MASKEIQKHIRLFLDITKLNDNTYDYQYSSLMDNGVVVELKGLMISQPTQITVELTSVSNASYAISDCLIPCDQDTLSAKIHIANDKQVVTLVDLDNELLPEEYNFIIIAKSLATQEQIVCDPQIHNKGKDGL